MNIEAHLLLFKTTFRLSYGISRYRLCVCLRLANGENVGLGSGIYYGCPPIKAYRDLQKILLPLLRETRLDNLHDMRQRVADLYGVVDGGALYAADLALWDLEARYKQKTVAELLGFGTIKRIRMPVTEQLWAVSPEELEAELQPILDRGTSQLKVKVRIGRDGGISFLKRIREICGPQMRLKVDINCEYSDIGSAVHKLQSMEKIGVELAEDPLPIDFDFLKYRELKKALTSMKVMIDYQMSDLETISRALDHDAFDVLNVKLSRVGGITRAIPLIKRCVEAGKEISVGCNEDLGPAMYGILHLSSVVPSYYGTEGVGWYRLKSKVLSEEPQIEKGQVSLPGCKGLQALREFDFQGNCLHEKVLNNPSFHFVYFSLQRRSANFCSRIGHTIFGE